MSHIPAALARQVMARARNRCEYCGLSQIGQEATFHVDHVIPIAQQGRTTIENLALACVSCSLRKGARLTAMDPEIRAEAPLFNPRTERWAEHFRWEGVSVVGLTPSGRATVDALNLNRPVIQAIREEEAARGRHPPPAS